MAGDVGGGRNVRALILVAATIAIGVASACSLLGSTWRYRYRMAVEVETPEGVNTGFGVYEQTVGKSNVDFGELSAKRGVRTRGEAVAVDLPNGQTLFALMPDSEVAQAALDPQWHNDWVESAQRISSGRTPRSPLPIRPAPASDPPAPQDKGPVLIRFRDIEDPGTVEQVDPADLAASFGPGVRLRAITVQVTDDPVTVGIEKRLNWLRGYFDRSFTGERFTNPYGRLIENLRAGSFSTELRP
jgi:hypothetical protein